MAKFDNLIELIRPLSRHTLEEREENKDKNLKLVCLNCFNNGLVEDCVREIKMGQLYNYEGFYCMVCNKIQSVAHLQPNIYQDTKEWLICQN